LRAVATKKLLQWRRNKLILQKQHNQTMKNTLIAPSVLAADFANLQRDIEMINNSEADWFHIDIMDGVFVPNISFGMPVLEAIKRHAKKNNRCTLDDCRSRPIYQNFC
jgi:ribulose-phosphate 3-epimerase